MTAIPAVSPHITQAATILVLEVLGNPRCEKYRKDQIVFAAAQAIGLQPTQRGAIGEITLGEDLLRNLRKRGKHEYEVEAIEDVLIRWYRRYA